MNALDRLRRKQASRALRILAKGSAVGIREMFPIDESTAAVDSKAWQGSMMRKLADHGVVQRVGPTRSRHMKYQLVPGKKLDSFQTAEELDKLVSRSAPRGSLQDDSDGELPSSPSLASSPLSEKHPAASTFLAQAEGLGLALNLISQEGQETHQVTYKARPGVMTEDLRAALVSRKSQVISLLSAISTATIPDEVIRATSEILEMLGKSQNQVSEPSEGSSSAGEPTYDPAGSVLLKVVQETFRLVHATVQNCIYIRDRVEELRGQQKQIQQGVEKLLAEWKIPVPWAS